MIVEPPATTRPFLLVLLDRVLDAVPVEAFVLDELRVLGGDHRALQLRRDPLVGHPPVAAAAPSGSSRALVHPLRHERRLARRVVAVPADVRGDPREPSSATTRSRRAPGQRTAQRSRAQRTRRSSALRGYSLRSSSPFVNDPRARDVEDVGVALDVGRERRERRRHLDDLHRRGVEHALPGRAVDLDVLDAAVAPDRHRQQQAAVELQLRARLRDS